LALTRVTTVAEAETLLRALGITVGVMLVSLMAIVWVYFGTGDKWLALLWSGASSGLLLWPAVVLHVVLMALLIRVYLSDKAAKT
jgi:hypothetical protein